MKTASNSLVNELLEGESPKEFLKRHDARIKCGLYATRLRLHQGYLVKAAVDEAEAEDRVLVARAMRDFGVRRNIATLIGMEAGSSQAMVGTKYLRELGLSGYVLDAAATYMRFYYRLMSGKLDAQQLYHQYFP